jgi:predicted phosphodiesterase
MRIAVVSDIHGNLTALEAVLADLRKVSADLIVQGGDLVGGSSDAEVIDLVRECDWPGVCGNAEERIRKVVLTETIPFICQAIGEERLGKSPNWRPTLRPASIASAA